MGSKRKEEMVLDFPEFPRFLRGLADELERWEPENGLDFSSLQLEAKQKYGKILLKLKIKAPEAEPSPSSGSDGSAKESLPSYSSLKKRMKSSYKVIFSTVHADLAPPREAVEEFLKDSALMVRYPRKGDEYYSDYTAACESLAAAYASNDKTGLHQACDRLDQLMHDCHGRYK